MDAFKRVFKYVWPQWPRLILIVSTVLIIAVFFAMSFMTILPLLKVVMGEEGIHGWVDRSISNARYDVGFYVPDRVDLSSDEGGDIRYYLRITDVDDDGAGFTAGLLTDDIIVGVGEDWPDESGGKIASSRLLENLAVASDDAKLAIQFKRVNAVGELEVMETELVCGDKPFYANTIQKFVSVLPREESHDNAEKAVKFIILLMVFVTFVRCTARFLQAYTVNKVMHTAIARLREDAFVHSMSIPVGFFAVKGSSDTVSRLVRDASQIGVGIKILLGKTLREPAKAIAMVGCAMWINYKLTLIFLCGAPAAGYVMGLLGKKIKRATKKSLISWSQMLGKLDEVMNSVRVVKVYNRQEYEHKAVQKINNNLLKQQFRVAKADAAAGPTMETLGMVAGAVGLMFGIHWVYSGKMQASDFFTLLIMLGVIAESIRKLGNVWNKLQQANAAAERVYEVIDEPKEYEAVNAQELAVLKKGIEFKNVAFTYPGAPNPILKDVNLTVEAGHSIAIVGPNGSGKTTLLNLIPRFYDPDSGQILVDGADIHEVSLSSLRGQIGMVTQNVVTFNDTIAANIAYGDPDAGRDAIVAAAKKAFAHEFIEPLPDGYDTMIGEGGSGLSGGQLQRIVIARAILKNPAILIFDEATSQIDSDSEAKIHKVLEEFMADRVSFVIAHRFSTIMNADVIVVMDKGRIVAKGEHSELLKDCKLYKTLYETQLLKG